MSEELFLDRCANPSPLTLDRPALADGYTELSVPLPQLQRLRALRDALMALKGPLGERTELRENLERALLSSESRERVLGKQVAPPLPVYR